MNEYVAVWHLTFWGNARGFFSHGDHTILHSQSVRWNQVFATPETMLIFSGQTIS